MMFRKNFKNSDVERKRLEQENRCCGLSERPCSVEFSEKRHYDKDHIIPVSEGGDNSYENLRLLCLDCHRTISDAYKTAKSCITNSIDVPPETRRILDGTLDCSQTNPSYFVEKITNHRYDEDGRIQFHVRWKYYKELTWEYIEAFSENTNIHTKYMKENQLLPTDEYLGD